MDNYQKFFDNLYDLEKGSKPSVGSFVWNNLKIPSDVKSILDVGCWRGDFLNFLPDDYDKTGVDISEEALKEVKAKTFACSVEELPFDPENFDLVTCFEVLEHVPYNGFQKSINEIERVSKKYIAVSVPNNQMLKQAFVKCRYCGCIFNPDYHVRAFDETRLKNLFGDFTMVSCIECGPMISDYAPLINFLVPLIGVRPQPSTICPQCGYSESLKADPASTNRTKNSTTQGKNSARSIASKLKSIFRVNKRPYCLLAFYKRKGIN